MSHAAPNETKGDWSLVDLQWHGDDRGGLVVVEGAKDVPFEIRRVYYLVGTKPGTTRGHHAHRQLDQVLVAVSGSCRVKVDDGRRVETFRLDSNVRGLRITNLVWREMSEFSPDCVLVVFASDRYRESDYLRSYEEFLEAARKS